MMEMAQKAGFTLMSFATVLVARCAMACDGLANAWLKSQSCLDLFEFKGDVLLGDMLLVWS